MASSGPPASAASAAAAAHQQQLRLEHLFRRCDAAGSGYIDREEFRELCRGFDIGDCDADIIFYDLDHDGDGRISFEDFSYGFRRARVTFVRARPPGVLLKLSRG